MTSRRFPPPWQVEQTPGSYKVLTHPAKPWPTSSQERHVNRPTPPSMLETPNVKIAPMSNDKTAGGRQSVWAR